MKNFRKALVLGAMILVIGAASVTAAFAASAYNTPAEAAAAVTGKTVEDVTSQKAETGKTYGAIAADAGKLTEFQAAMLEVQKARLDARVKAGTLTQEQADKILAQIKENQQNCDGTGSARIGRQIGGGCGGMNGGWGGTNGTRGQGGCGAWAADK